MPLLVTISCFVISKMYGSKVFGKSYFMLGLSYLSYFIGEVIYFFYVDTLNLEDPIIADLFFIISPPLLITHIIINIRYFAEKLEDYQKILLIIIPTLIILGYSLFVNITPPEDRPDFYFNLIFVSLSSAMLAFTTVGFTTFRHTNLVCSVVFAFSRNIDRNCWRHYSYLCRNFRIL